MSLNAQTITEIVKYTKLPKKLINFIVEVFSFKEVAITARKTVQNKNTEFSCRERVSDKRILPATGVEHIDLSYSDRML